MNDEYEEYGAADRLNGKGFYIALGLCICVIALSAWVILSAKGSREPQAEVPVAEQQPVNWLEEEKPAQREPVSSVVAPETVETMTEPAPVQTPETAVQEPSVPQEPVLVPEPEPQAPVEAPLNTGVYLWPVVGEVEVPYSMDALTYNVTMSDWRTHDGIDILAEAGTVVMAAAGGKVEDVYADDLYGTTVVIDHGAGLKSYYANLQETPNVAVGDTVMAGQTIGAVGKTAICENNEPFHLHLAMSLDGQSVNPADYLPKL